MSPATLLGLHRGSCCPKAVLPAPACVARGDSGSWNNTGGKSLPHAGPDWLLDLPAEGRGGGAWGDIA